ncbi:MAG TPA: hypothetical protein VMV44_13700 [Rectinemataceae bacterium]|nr:hypothetical protein [Rectinemataceae bacterium]
MDERERLAAEIGDEDIIDYFYLRFGAEEVLDKLEALKVEMAVSQDLVPFNAQVKGYFGAVDDAGHPWILKPAVDPKEILYHRTCTLSYLLDHFLGSLSAPTTVFTIGGKVWRATKVIQHAMQISSYDYLQQPFIDWLRADLINRWVSFDEDRNPNNYLVIHNKATKPFLVAIDFDKADFTATQMKITGNQEKFGWHRTEKTRFLTLLRPDNFEGVSIETFEARLCALMAIPEEALGRIARRLVEGWSDDPAGLSATLVANLVARRNYVDGYFRTMFKSASETKSACNDDDYSMFGASFVAMHKGKK